MKKNSTLTEQTAAERLKDIVSIIQETEQIRPLTVFEYSILLAAKGQKVERKTPFKDRLIEALQEDESGDFTVNDELIDFVENFK